MACTQSSTLPSFAPQHSLSWLENLMPMLHPLTLLLSPPGDLAVFVFDPREFAGSSASSASPSIKLDKIGVHRAKFLLESVAELRTALRAKNSDLIVRVSLCETLRFPRPTREATREVRGA